MWFCCDTPLVPLHTCVANLPKKAKRVGDNLWRELPWAKQLVQDMQRHRGAPEVEPSGDECADADDIDVALWVGRGHLGRA